MSSERAGGVPSGAAGERMSAECLPAGCLSAGCGLPGGKEKNEKKTEMKNIVLAAGYATRLYPLTENFPKPLLEVGGRSLLDRLVEDIDGIRAVDEHIVVTNHRFIGHFEAWASAARGRYRCPVTLLDDGSTDNDHRVGAVCDLLLALDRRRVEDDILVVAADNVTDFPFGEFVRAFAARGTSMIMCHRETSPEALRKTGVVALDADDRVLLMQEKPAEPVSEWAVPPFYIYRREDLPLVRGAMEGGCRFDAPGNLARYLCERVPMHAWKMQGRRYDIGDLKSYTEVKELFDKR